MVTSLVCLHTSTTFFVAYHHHFLHQKAIASSKQLHRLTCNQEEAYKLYTCMIVRPGRVMFPHPPLFGTGPVENRGEAALPPGTLQVAERARGV